MTVSNDPVAEIHDNIVAMANEQGWVVNEKTSNRIAKAKHRFFVSNGEDWKRCPCYPPDDTIHGCGTEACTADIVNDGVCHCNLYLRKDA